MRCLDSIPVREDVQVIVVDDCSPGAEHYLEQYPALSRPYLEFYSTSEGGSAGRARNVGLQHARGQWVLFADADDYYQPGFLETLLPHLSSDLDILYFNIAGDGERAVTHRRIFDLYRQHDDDTEVRYHIWAPWNKVISLPFIRQHQLQFDEIPVGNDALFGLRASQAARRYSIVDLQLYHLTDRPGSLSFGDKNSERHDPERAFRREMSYIEVRTRITQFLTPLGLHLRYGYHTFSLARLRRFISDYGWGNTLRYLCFVIRHYGLVRALCYNHARRQFERQHPDLIYCD